MKSVQVKVDYPAKLSRGILLLKTFLGWLICIPHFICVYILMLAACVVLVISWFAVLFTGKFPKGMFDFVVGVMNWGLRLSAYFGLMRDEYPPFGLKKAYPASYTVTYPAKLSRGILILRLLFGWAYVGIPHVICLYGRMVVQLVIFIIAWFAILFTGKFPQKMFNFTAGTLRWGMNVNTYLMFMTDEYPPFTGKA